MGKFEEVTPEWIKQQMLDLNMSAADAAREMEISRGDMSAYLSGKKPLSNIRKQTFYYFFYIKNAERFSN